MAIKKVRINAISVALMVRALMDDAHTEHELVELSGLHIRTVRSYVRAMQKAGGCYVHHWEPDTYGRHVVASYALGTKRDAVRPVQTKRESNLKHRARVRALKAIQATAGQATA